MQFQKATKYGTFLKLGMAGPPGSGKTYSALNIAKYLSEKRIAVIDSESGAARKYAGINGFEFDVLELLEPDEKGRDIEKPFAPERYMEAIKMARSAGIYDVLIIDGISEEWTDAGGILQYVDAVTRNNDTRAAWKKATPLHKNFINYILRARIHIICTMQAKKEMVATKDVEGKAIGKKVTLAPIQREDIDRVFDIFCLLQDKDMMIDKTRCSALDGQVFHKPGREIADILREWLKGDPMPERPEYDPEALQLSLGNGTPNSITPIGKATSQPSQHQQTRAREEVVKTYRIGMQRHLWQNESGFYAAASAVSGLAVNSRNVNDLSDAVLQELLTPPKMGEEMEQPQEVA